MIDFHSHVLPGIDDGSRSIEESISLIESLKGMGACRIFATPHFFAGDETAKSFLQRRDKAYNELISKYPSASELVFVGAEIAYYPGVSRMDELRELALFGTSLVLIEMPHDTWSEYILRELVTMPIATGLYPVIAHVERYMDMQSSATLGRLAESGVLMQANASFFLEKKTVKKAMKLLSRGEIHVLGSDCHSIDYRPPRLRMAYDAIEEKLGRGVLDSMIARSYKLAGLSPASQASRITL
jgi:protein-tyrosine phosphatase